MNRSRLVDWATGSLLPERWTSAKFVGCLSGMMALLTGTGVALSPYVFHVGISAMVRLFVAVAWTGVTGVLLGYGCNYFNSVLEYAVSGGKKPIQVPVRNPGPAVASLLRWMLCFISGPAALISLALRYWMHCGEVTGIDGIALAGLTVPAVGYWVMQLLVLGERPELTRASPMQVLDAIRRLRRRALLAAIGITAAAFVYVCAGAYAVLLLHRAWLMGLVLLWLCWYSAWECGAYALRTVGFWYYESGRAADRVDYSQRESVRVD
jgi:hypothetical protein